MGWQTVVATVFQAGNRIVLNRNGLFIYNGSPANGNLIVSATFASGTDSFGNTYFAGINSFGQSSVGRGFVNVSVDQSSGNTQVTMQAGSPLANNLGSSPGLTSAILFPGTSVERQDIFITAGTETGARTSSIQLTCESFDLSVFPSINIVTDSVTTNGLSALTYFFNLVNALSLTSLPNFMSTVSNPGGVNEVTTFALDSGKENSHDDAYVILMGQPADASAAAQIQLGIGSSANLIKILKTGTTLGNPITANAGTTSSPTNITSDTWHQQTVFNNGWTGQNAGFWYRLTNDKELEILGDLNGGPAGNSSILTFTGVYVPNLSQNHPAGQNNVGGTSPEWVELTNAGVLNAVGVPVAGEEIFFHITVPVNLVNGGFG